LEKMNRDTRMDAMEELTPLGGARALVDHLTKSDLGPFVLVFGLLIAGFVMCAGGMILLVLGPRIALALFILLVIVGVIAVIVEVRDRSALDSHRRGPKAGKWDQTEKWAIALGWWLPRRHRDSIVGDILEDCHEMRERGLAKRRILTHVLWQWVISVVTLIPLSIMGAIRRLVGAK
jgi:hypothetical protein